MALINVRNKDYWFSPERREESLEFLKNRILWIEIATLGFLVALAQILFKENLGDAPPRLSGDFWYVMVVFVVAVLWLGLQIVLRFRAPKEQASL